MGGKSVCGRLMSPAHETQSMREIRLLRGRLPRKGGGLTGMDLLPLTGMIPLYDLGPLGGPKIIASKLKFPIWKKNTVLLIFPENIRQRCRFYTIP